jgi:CYTH domain-containing protein
MNNVDLTLRTVKNFEIERKFLLNDIPKYVLDNAISCVIRQDYILVGSFDINHISSCRVRKMYIDGMDLYTHTIKNPIGSNLALSENETVLSLEEYEEYLKQSSSFISKTRYTIVLEDNKYEFDKFHDLNIIIVEMEKISSNWNNTIQLEKEIMNIKLPKIIEDVLIEEVTGNVEYSNKKLSIKY